MASWDKGGSSQKRKAQASPKGSGRGVQRARSLSNYHQRYFSSQEQYTRYMDHFQSKKPLDCKVVDLHFFDREGFQLSDLLHGMGWDTFVSLNIPIYPTLVKVFYSNLQCQFKPIKITSEVKGVHIELTAKIMGQIFQIPAKGHRIADGITDVERLVDDYDKADVMKKITGKESTGERQKVTSSDLNIENRLLHHFIARIIYPKSGNFSCVSEFEQFILWCILEGEELNLPHLILSHMISSTNKQTAHLPYAMHITRILEHFEVDLTGEEHTKLTSFDIYNEASMHRMHFYKENGIWVKRAHAGMRHGGGDEGEEGLEAPREVQREAMSSSQILAQQYQILEALQRLQSSVAILDSKMDITNTRLDGMDVKLAALEEHHQQCHQLKSQAMP